MTIAKAIARAWRDPDYKAKLLSDPHAALADVGIAVSDGAKVKVVENTDRAVHLVLPVKPAGAIELSEIDLEKAAGGTMKHPFLTSAFDL